MLTDLAPHQQAAAIVMRLGGAARDLARTITPQEILQGGVINGIQYDPVSYIVYGLHQRFAQLGEESRLIAMTDMINFSRRPNEAINDLLTRYETVRQKARDEGQFVMSIEGCALQLLRACGCSTPQFTTFLQRFEHRLPTTEDEFNLLMNDNPGNKTTWESLCPSVLGNKFSYSPEYGKRPRLGQPQCPHRCHR